MYEVIMRGGKTNPEFESSHVGHSICGFAQLHSHEIGQLSQNVWNRRTYQEYFPHLFNRKENENYVGPIPPTPYYSPNGMSPKDRETFLAWHASKKESNYVFNLNEEILTYCRSDVDILRRCCSEFRELFHEVTDIDPFRAFTIASACHMVYRSKYLSKDTIAIIPPMGYTPNAKQSLIAHKWLSYLSEKNDVYIQHARDGGKKRVGDYWLDGYCEEIHTAFEFHGCFWHGEFVFRYFFIAYEMLNKPLFYRMSEMLCPRYCELRQSQHHGRTLPSDR